MGVRLSLADFGKNPPASAPPGRRNIQVHAVIPMQPSGGYGSCLELKISVSFPSVCLNHFINIDLSFFHRNPVSKPDHTVPGNTFHGPFFGEGNHRFPKKKIRSWCRLPAAICVQSIRPKHLVVSLARVEALRAPP
jgi:hypothetical protein